MISRIDHTEVEAFYLTRKVGSILPDHWDLLKDQLMALSTAVSAEDMNIPGWDLSPIAGEAPDLWSISLPGNWRLVFRFEGVDVHVMNYEECP